MTTKVLLRAVVLLALVGCGGGGRRGPVDGGGGDGGVATGDAGGGKDASDAQTPDDADGATHAGGGDTGSAADAADGGPVPYTPGTKQCVGSTAEICLATGDGWNRLACPNGCDACARKPISPQHS